MKVSHYTGPGDSVCFSITIKWVTEQCVHINLSEDNVSQTRGCVLCATIPTAP